MAYLQVKGKVFHCQQCGGHLRIEYKDGARPTQIGEMGILEQKRLTEKYGQADPTAYDLHVEGGLCQDCFMNLKPSNEQLNDWRMAWRIDDATRQLFMLHYQYSLQIAVRVESILTRQSALLKPSEYKAAAYHQLLEDQRLSDASQRQQLVQQYAQRVLPQAEAELTQAMKENQSIRTLITEYEQECRQLIEAIQPLFEQMKDRNFAYFRLGNTKAAENLHPLVYAPLSTVRVPLPPKDEVLYYFPATFRGEAVRMVCEPIRVERIFHWYYRGEQVEQELCKTLIKQVEQRLGIAAE